MLHTKFRENRPAGSEEDFEGFLPYMGVAAIFGHVTQMPRTKFRSPYPVFLLENKNYRPQGLFLLESSGHFCPNLLEIPDIDRTK